ncbi:MAG: MG2 domain-containing protein, partial [Nannocystaceae bacterium]
DCKGPNSYDCYPGSIQIASNNVLDGPTFEHHVTVEPPVKNLVVNANSGLYLSGEFLGKQTYTVTVGTDAKDAHGQSLNRPYRTTFTMPALDPSLGYFRPQKATTVLEAGHNGIVDLRVAGLSTVETRTRTIAAGELRPWLKARFEGEDTDERTSWPVDVDPYTNEKVYATKDSFAQVKKLGLDLSANLAKVGDMAFVNVRSNKVKQWRDWQRLHLSTIYQRTDLGVTAALDRDSGVVLVTSLERGQPVAGAKVTLLSDDGATTVWTGTTDAKGIANIAAYIGNLRRGYILAEHNKDASYTPLQHDVHGGWHGGYYGSQSAKPVAFFYTDRAPYKPGDTIHLSGMLRQRTTGPSGGVEQWRTGFEAEYTVTGPRGHELTKGKVQVTAFGTFTVDIETKKDGDTGQYNFRLNAPSGLFGSAESFHHSVPVETYRAPEFTVAVERAGGEAPLFYGEKLEADIRGKYLHGAPLAGGEVSYTIRREDTAFSPPGSENEPYTFGQGRGNYWAGRHRFG